MYKPHETVLKTEHYSLQHYLPIGELTDPTPTYVQPPYAGRDHEVTDRLVRTCQEAGRHVYRFILHNAVPWFGTPFSMEDFISAIDRCQAYIREKHNVPQLDAVATCQGGVVTGIHNSLNPHLYRRHSFSATPINNKTGLGGTIEDYCATADMGYHRMRVAMNGGVQLGIDQWTAFSAMDLYEAMFGRWYKLANVMAFEQDKEKVKQKVSNSLWRDRIMNLHGGWYLFTMEFFFIKNQFYNGTLVVGGKVADPANIICPILVTVGENDPITLPKSSEGIVEKASSEEKTYMIFGESTGYKGKHGHTAPFTWEKCLAYFKHHFYTAPQGNLRMEDLMMLKA